MRGWRLASRLPLLLLQLNKSNRPLGWLRRVHEFTDRFENAGDGLVVRRDFALQLGQLLGEFLVGSEQFAHAHEGTHDLDVDRVDVGVPDLTLQLLQGL